MPRRASPAALALLAAALACACAKVDESPRLLATARATPPATVPRRLFAVPISPGAFLFMDGDVSPDGRSFAFVEYWLNGDRQIRVADMAGGGARTLVHGQGERSAVTWSPDGREIAYASPDGVMAVDARSGAKRRVWTGDLEATWTQWRGDGRIAFAGKEIKLWGEPEPPLHPMAAAADGAVSEPVEMGVELMTAPSYGPDGARAAFFLEERAGRTLWVMDLASGRARCMATVLADGHPPVWSRDGGELYFIARPDSGRGGGQVHATRIREGGARLLEIAPWVHDVSVDARGNLFLVSAADAGYEQDALWLYPRAAVERAMSRPLDVPACRRPPRRLRR